MSYAKGFRCGRWNIDLTPRGEDQVSYHIFSRDEDGKKEKYEIVPGKHGEPLIVAEPDLAFDPPPNLQYTNAKNELVKPDQKISGIICVDGPRFSLGEAKRQGIQINVNEDGSLQVGKDKWWIGSLFVKDKECFVGYEAICTREKPEDDESGFVDILDIGDIVDKLLQESREWEDLMDTLLKKFK